MDELAEFDRPVFKQLAHNDTGAAVGHQGGIVIPLALDPYFPQLSGKISPENPTIDENIQAILVVGGKQAATVSTRYQFQSWGGLRSPERRITGMADPLRRHGDILEQLGGTQSIIRSRPIIAEASRLYSDPLSGRPRKGAAGKGGGSIRRFARVLRQLDLTFDPELMPPGGLGAILPAEFDDWKK